MASQAEEANTKKGMPRATPDEWTTILDFLATTDEPRLDKHATALGRYTAMRGYLAAITARLAEPYVAESPVDAAIDAHIALVRTKPASIVANHTFSVQQDSAGLSTVTAKIKALLNQNNSLVQTMLAEYPVFADLANLGSAIGQQAWADVHWLLGQRLDNATEDLGQALNETSADNTALEDMRRRLRQALVGLEALKLLKDKVWIPAALVPTSEPQRSEHVPKMFVPAHNGAAAYVVDNVRPDTLNGGRQLYAAPISTTEKARNHMLVAYSASLQGAQVWEASDTEAWSRVSAASLYSAARKFMNTDNELASDNGWLCADASWMGMARRALAMAHTAPLLRDRRAGDDNTLTEVGPHELRRRTLAFGDMQEDADARMWPAMRSLDATAIVGPATVEVLRVQTAPGGKLIASFKLKLPARVPPYMYVLARAAGGQSNSFGTFRRVAGNLRVNNAKDAWAPNAFDEPAWNAENVCLVLEYNVLLHPTTAGPTPIQLPRPQGTEPPPAKRRVAPAPVVSAQSGQPAPQPQGVEPAAKRRITLTPVTSAQPSGPKYKGHVKLYLSATRQPSQIADERGVLNSGYAHMPLVSIQLASSGIKESTTVDLEWPAIPAQVPTLALLGQYHPDVRYTNDELIGMRDTAMAQFESLRDEIDEEHQDNHPGLQKLEKKAEKLYSMVQGQEEAGAIYATHHFDLLSFGDKLSATDGDLALLVWDAHGLWPTTDNARQKLVASAVATWRDMELHLPAAHAHQLDPSLASLDVLFDTEVSTRVTAASVPVAMMAMRLMALRAHPWTPKVDAGEGTSSTAGREVRVPAGVYEAHHKNVAEAAHAFKQQRAALLDMYRRVGQFKQKRAAPVEAVVPLVRIPPLARQLYDAHKTYLHARQAMYNACSAAEPNFKPPAGLAPESVATYHMVLFMASADALRSGVALDGELRAIYAQLVDPTNVVSRHPPKRLAMTHVTLPPPPPNFPTVNVERLLHNYRNTNPLHQKMTTVPSLSSNAVVDDEVVALNFALAASEAIRRSTVLSADALLSEKARAFFTTGIGMDAHAKSSMLRLQSQRWEFIAASAPNQGPPGHHVIAVLLRNIRVRMAATNEEKFAKLNPYMLQWTNTFRAEDGQTKIESALMQGNVVSLSSRVARGPPSNYTRDWADFLQQGLLSYTTTGGVYRLDHGANHATEDVPVPWTAQSALEVMLPNQGVFAVHLEVPRWATTDMHTDTPVGFRNARLAVPVRLVQGHTTSLLSPTMPYVAVLAAASTHQHSPSTDKMVHRTDGKLLQFALTNPADALALAQDSPAMPEYTPDINTAETMTSCFTEVLVYFVPLPPAPVTT